MPCGVDMLAHQAWTWGVGLRVQPAAGAASARVKAAHLGEAEVEGELQTLISFTLYFLQIH